MKGLAVRSRQVVTPAGTRPAAVHILEPGFDADIVIWNPDTQFQVDPHKLFYRHKIKSYSGMTLSGVVETTLVRGNVAYDRGIITSGPLGNVLFRSRN